MPLVLNTVTACCFDGVRLETMKAVHVFKYVSTCFLSSCVCVCLIRKALLWPLHPCVDPHPVSLSVTDEHNLSFQIHERLQHYEESKPAPVQDNAASLARQVNFFLFIVKKFWHLFDSSSKIICFWTLIRDLLKVFTLMIMLVIVQHNIIFTLTCHTHYTIVKHTLTIQQWKTIS